MCIVDRSNPQSCIWSKLFYFKTKRNGILIIEHGHHGEGKPLFEMCWFHMGIAQIALDPTHPPPTPGYPPTPLSNRQMWKNNSERPVDALAVKKMNDWLTHNLKSRDASASKKCPKPSWQAPSPTGNVGKKCPKPSWQAFTHPPHHTGNAYMETTHFKKGLPEVGNMYKTSYLCHSLNF